MVLFLVSHLESMLAKLDCCTNVLQLLMLSEVLCQNDLRAPLRVVGTEACPYHANENDAVKD